MLSCVISGGQTGADQAGLRAARAAGIATGGWAPKGWLTEDGPAPWLADYGLKEMPFSDYPPRTRANVCEADLTLWFGDPESRGGRLTLKECSKAGVAWEVIYPSVPRHHRKPIELAEFMQALHCRVINVAGNRESSRPGIGAWVEEYLTEVFRLLAERTSTHA